ncbi:phosphopyruvate hydratase [Patescibacteria group bacterium]|nr:phosphopyruvate hydratase [Patescibacteria group bacterium]MBU1890514.1 phosphopyruvate hydratase [Patescibacteria group bacterium]
MGVVITRVIGVEGIDSRPNPTPMAMVELSDEVREFAISPSGASTGEGEMHELRDNDSGRYGGKGVLSAVEAINGPIAEALVGMSPFDLSAVDSAMCALDTTGNLSDIGANSTTAVSYAVAKAAARSRGQELFEFLGGPSICQLPVPLCKYLDGGQHADNNLNVQEFMWAPVGAPTFAEAVRWLVECRHALADLLKDRGLATTVGDEGGFAPDLGTNREGLDIGVEAIKAAGFKLGTDICLALDPAASSFYSNGLYQVEPTGDPYSGDGLTDYWEALVAEYPIVSIEDGAAENDLGTWRKMHSRIGGKVQLIGDDVFCTNPVLLSQSLPPKSPFANSLLVKTNQIGNITDADDAARTAHRHGMTTCVSQRSGDTEGAEYADLAVAFGSGFIKPGAVSRSDRGAKYNRLLWIEKLLGKRAVYPGWLAFTSVPALYAKGITA